jgi:hypothetical protein
MCFFNGVSCMGVLIEGVACAIKNVGYENLTREAIIGGMESIKNANIFDVMTMTFSPDDHRGSRQMKVVQIAKDNSLVPVSDFFTVPEPPEWERLGEKLPTHYIP